MNDFFEDLIIFEMANNHQGSLAHGLQIIHTLGNMARQYRIKAAVKFQYRDLNTFIHPDYKNRKDVKHVSRFLSTRLSNDEFYNMVNAVRNEGMITMCTPFDEKSVDLCMDHGIDVIKIASCSAVDWPLLEKVCQTNRPVIISTGGKTFQDIDKIFNFLTHRNVDFAMMHCVGLYPVEYVNVQLDCIDKMRSRYPCVSIGYSGHENPNDFVIAQMAIAKGATILERHVGMETNKIKLNSYSTDARKIGSWISAILDARKICGVSGEKYITNEELTSMNELARGCFAATTINEGQEIQRDQVFFSMPCLEGQTTSGMFVPGIRATKNYNTNDPIFEKRPLSITSDTYNVLHDVKGMLYEARIVVGNQFELELSHHYGLEHFRSYGATLINIVNREYCKKLMIILPGQKHPTHYHKIKEESFQVLYGDLMLKLNGIEMTLNPGEVITVERNQPHSFTSKNGCIFEEISTTHVKNDSYYENEKINQLDLTLRKTVLKEW